MIARMMQNDKNNDGKLSKDEVPERMQAIFGRADANNDGFLTKDELTKMVQQRGSRGGDRGRGDESGGRGGRDRGDGGGRGRPQSDSDR
ncbi:MAG: hypothetical protein ABGX07_02525 [Pirellulaceae bacterium]